jgi:hypothetical protein
MYKYQLLIRPSIARHHQVRSLSSSWPKLESATGRARKRRRRLAQRPATTTRMSTPSVRSSSNKHEDDEEELKVLPYPRGQPWRVLWPHPHDNPMGTVQPKTRKIPRISDFQKAWVQYKATWDDGLRGDPSETKQKQQQQHHDKSVQDSSSSSSSETKKDPSLNNTMTVNLEDIGDNVSRNVTDARHEAQQLVDQAQERTGIRSHDDLRKVATDMMKLATECLKEFMVGYRQGRDEEVDKMLHEYFQEADDDDDDETKTKDEKESKQKRRRKPKRATLRE